MGQLIWLMKKDQEEKWNRAREQEKEEVKKREKEELDRCKEERLNRKIHDEGATSSKSTSGTASKKKVSPNNQTICIISKEIPYSPHNIQINSVMGCLEHATQVLPKQMFSTHNALN